MSKWSQSFFTPYCWFIAKHTEHSIFSHSQVGSPNPTQPRCPCREFHPIHPLIGLRCCLNLWMSLVFLVSLIGPMVTHLQLIPCTAVTWVWQVKTLESVHFSWKIGPDIICCIKLQTSLVKLKASNLSCHEFWAQRPLVQKVICFEEEGRAALCTSGPFARSKKNIKPTCYVSQAR